MITILDRPCFLCPTNENKNKRHTCISPNYECLFITDGMENDERMLRIVDNTPFYYVDDVGVIDYHIINSATKTNRNLAKGISCLPLAEDGEAQTHTALTFFFHEGQLYLLEDIEGVSGFTLMEVTSNNPEQDWRWLRATLVERNSSAAA